MFLIIGTVLIAFLMGIYQSRYYSDKRLRMKRCSKVAMLIMPILLASLMSFAFGYFYFGKAFEVEISVLMAIMLATSITLAPMSLGQSAYLLIRRIGIYMCKIKK